MEMAVGEAICLMGVCCSTFVAVNRGTSQRCEFVPQGNITAPSVYKANKMMSRPEPMMPQCFHVEPRSCDNTPNSPNHARLQVCLIVSDGNLPGNCTSHGESGLDADTPSC